MATVSSPPSLDRKAPIASSTASVRSSIRQSQQTAPSSPHTPQHQQRSMVSYNPSSSPVSSFRNEEEAVILEFGARWLKVGFEGESAPMSVVGFGPKESRKVGDYRGWIRTKEDGHNTRLQRLPKTGDWTREYELWRMDLREVNLGLVEDKIERAIREVYNKYLLTDAGSSRLVLVVPSVMPHPLLSTVLTTLFDRWKYPSITLLPAATMATVAAGLRSALVVDLGWAETVVTGVYEYREIKVERTVRAMKPLMQEMGKMLTELAGRDHHNANSDDRISAVFEFVEDIVCRLAWCEPSRWGREASDQNPSYQQSPFTSSKIAIPSPVNSDSTYINVPFSRFAEPVETVLFANGTADCNLDDHNRSVSMVVYRTLLALTPDVRGICMSRIVFIGGGSKIPGIRQRIMGDVASLVQEHHWNPIRGRAAEQQRQKLRELTINRQQLQQQRPSSPPSLLSTQSFPSFGAPSMNSSAKNTTKTDHERAKEPRLKRKDEETKEEELDFVEQRLRRNNKDVKPHIHGVFREVESLGAWAGASLVINLKARGLVEIEREKYLQHGLAGASRDLDPHHHVPDRRSGLNPSANRSGGDRSSWTLAGWG